MTRTGRIDGRALLAVVAGIALSGALVWQSSYAAFTATTSNPGNSWTAGTIALADNDSGAALFNASGLVPGSTGYRCITVDFTGTVGAQVRLYATPVTSGPTALAPYLELTVEEGTGTTATCSDFAASSTLYGTAPGFDTTKTLSTFTSSHSSHGTGLSAWAPTTAASRAYRISYRLKDDDAAQGAAASINFVWEARTAP
jgi:hypothetical protein